jgi:uncharacterized protein (TIGR02265 family)
LESERDIRSDVAEALELDWRLSKTPPSAWVRGLFFNMIADDLRRRGTYDAARPLLGPERRIYAFYPVSALLLELAVAAPFIHDDPHEAMRRAWVGGAEYFAASWFGRMFQRHIRPDPAAALDWIEKGRWRAASYGRWTCERVANNRVRLHMLDEYIWIGSAHRGGCEGLLAACGVPGEVTVALDEPLRGHLDVRW